jgi:hypothetical protein
MKVLGFWGAIQILIPSLVLITLMKSNWSFFKVLGNIHCDPDKESNNVPGEKRIFLFVSILIKEIILVFDIMFWKELLQLPETLLFSCLQVVT